MTINQPPPRSAREIIKLKRPMSVAIYDDYSDAAHAVDYLADHQFPVATLAIVGTDLKSVERVTGSMTWGKVLAAGFLQGALWAGMFTILMWFLQPGVDLLSLLGTALLGFGLISMAMSALQYRMRRPDRDYTSTTAIIATHYEVLAESEYADKARGLLSGGSQHQTREVAAPAAPMAPPPQQADLDKLPPPAWPAPAPEPPPAPDELTGRIAAVTQPAQHAEPSSLGQVMASPGQQPETADDNTGAMNQSYGQYWSAGDAPGIGDLPKRFSEAEESEHAPQTGGHGEEPRTPRRGDFPESSGD